MAKHDTDWEGVEREYRAGQLSLDEIGKMYGISKGRISQKAKAEGWKQDLSNRIKARAEAKLNERLVKEKLNESFTSAPDIERVEAGAEAIASIITEHRGMSKRMRERVSKYEEELSTCGEELGEKIKMLKSLAETAKIIVNLERQSLGLKESDSGDADKQPENTNLAPNDAARRVAFMLTQALKGN